jgi:hypothetical protein
MHPIDVKYWIQVKSLNQDNDYRRKLLIQLNREV